MTPLLATNYGNMYVFLLGVPALLIAVILGAIGILFRFKPLAVCCGIVVFVIALGFFYSLIDAAKEDFVLTISFALSSFLAAVALVFLERTPRR